MTCTIRCLTRPTRTAGALFVAVSTLAHAQGPDGPYDAPRADPTGWHPPAPREGLVLRSADGRSELTFEGLLRADARWNGGAPRSPESEYELSRMRLGLAGRFEESLRFRLEPNFAEEGVELEEAWLGTDLFDGQARFMAGRMRVPFGLEEMRSQHWIDFPRLSILHQLTPGPDAGLFLFGTSQEGLLEWNLAVSNGTGGSESNGAKDFAGRLMLHPFRDERQGARASGWRGALEKLQVGAAATVGDQDQDLAGETLDNAAGLPLMIFAPDARLDGRRTRAGLEGAWHHGPWFVQGELMKVRQEMSVADSDHRIDLDGGYLGVSYALTGEERSFGGVLPARRFDARSGGGGAWIVGLRYSELHSEGELAASGLLLPDTWVGRIRSVELGLSWVLSRNAVVRVAYVRSAYSNDVLVRDQLIDREDAILLQLQLGF